MTGRVEWSRGPADSRAIRWALSLWFGFVGSLALGALVVVGTVALGAAVDGEYAILAAVVLLSLVGSWASLLYLMPILSDPEVRSGFGEVDLLRELRPAEAVVGTIVALLVLGVALTLGSPVFAIALAGVIAAMVVGTGLRTWGAIDPESGTLEYGEDTVELDGLTGFRTYEVGDTVLFRLSFAHGYVDVGTPQSVVVPAADASAVESALEATIDEDVEPREGDPTARLIVTAVGVVCAASAVGLVLASRLGDVDPVVELLALVLGINGALFLAASRYV